MKQDYIDSLSSEQVLDQDIFDSILAIPDNYERQELEERIYLKAKKLGVGSSFKKLLKAYKIKKISQREINKGNTTNFIDQPIPLYCGDWICDNSGVHKTVADNRNGDMVVKYASKMPIMILEYLRNIDTDAFKVKLAYFRDGWKTLIVNASTVASNTKIVELADCGIMVDSSTSKLLVDYLSTLAGLNEDIIQKYDAVTHLGWVDNKFIPYDDDYRFDGEAEYKSVFEQVRSKGDRRKWMEFTEKLRKNIIVRLAMGVSLGSVLLKKVHALPFILHLWGGTESGKTVTQMVAASVWGNPEKGGMWRSINNTPNFESNISAFFYSMPVILDELQTIKENGGSYDKLIMVLTEGINRGRMYYNKIEKTKTWDCAYLFSGEESITKENSGGGAKNRVIEVECTEKIIEDGPGTVSFILENYGFLGEDFIFSIKYCINHLRERYSCYHKEILEKCDTTEKQAMAMAVILTADEFIAGNPNFYGNETPLTVEDIKPFLMSKAEVDITQRAWEYTVNLIAINAAKFDGSSYENWGSIDGDIVLINKAILLRELSVKGFEFDAVKRKWAERGWLVKNSQGKLLHNTRCNGIKANYIKLNMKNQEENSNETPPF